MRSISSDNYTAFNVQMNVVTTIYLQLAERNFKVVLVGNSELNLQKIIKEIGKVTADT